MHRSPFLDALQSMRAASGPAWTKGLADEVVERFAARDPRLARAIEAAVEQRAKTGASYGQFFRMAEEDLCRLLQRRILNFYSASSPLDR